MSDGAISQDEIDALLAGVDMGGFSSSSSSSNDSVNIDTATIEKFVGDLSDSLKNNLGTMTGATFEVGKPVVEVVDRDGALKKVPEMVVSIVSDFNTALVGEHIYILSPDFTQKITGLVNNEPNPELDDMALSVISEVVSSHTGTEITQLSQGGKLPGLASNPADANHAPKAMVRFPQGKFAFVSYPVTVDGSSFTIWEAFAQEVADGIATSLGGGSQSSSSNGALSAADLAGLGGGMGMPNMGMDMSMGGGMPNMGAAQMNPMQTMTMPNMGMPNMGMPNMNPMAQMPVMGMNNMPNMSNQNMAMVTPNVQALQFPNLQHGLTGMEQGNIGLIMDVKMEMTVELGRTKKLIKEILGMGEGTIIELDKLAGEPVDILVNHKAIAKGEVVVIDENFGVRVTEILSPMERVADLH